MIRVSDFAAKAVGFQSHKASSTMSLSFLLVIAGQKCPDYRDAKIVEEGFKCQTN